MNHGECCAKPSRIACSEKVLHITLILKRWNFPTFVDFFQAFTISAFVKWLVGFRKKMRYLA